MADVSIKLSLSEASEVKAVLTEMVGLRAKVLDSAEMRREYQSREGGSAEWKSLQERFVLLESALRKLA